MIWIVDEWKEYSSMKNKQTNKQTNTHAHPLSAHFFVHEYVVWGDAGLTRVHVLCEHDSPGRDLDVGTLRIAPIPIPVPVPRLRRTQHKVKTKRNKREST